MSKVPIAAGNEATAAIRLWCLKSPRPALLRVYGKDDRTHEVEIKQGTSWSDAAVSICALLPDRLEAYTAEGKLIRAVPVDDLIRKEETQAAQQAATFTAMNTTDPETQRMIVFAELLERHSSRCIDAIRETAGAAFEQMQQISASLALQATASTQSANELSVAIRNLLVQQAQEAVEAAGTVEESPMEKLASNFLSGQALAEAQRQQAPAAGGAAPKNGKTTNGKHS